MVSTRLVWARFVADCHLNYFSLQNKEERDGKCITLRQDRGRTNTYHQSLEFTSLSLSTAKSRLQCARLPPWTSLGLLLGKWPLSLSARECNLLITFGSLIESTRLPKRGSGEAGDFLLKLSQLMWGYEMGESEVLLVGIVLGKAVHPPLTHPNRLDIRQHLSS